MKIDRRSFLSFGIGAAAGIGLSPLPWKLTDDLSIWSQNWSWTPVPEDGEVSYVNSVCTLCPGGCGITVKKVENRAIKIEGMKGYPGNDGKACPLGLSGLQLLYGPTAIKSPMKKVDGKWQKISWDEAITEISGKLAELRKSGKAHTLGCITESGYGTVPALFKRFLTAYGSPNFMTTPSYEDSYDMTLKLMQGVDASAGFDVENANFVLSFGSGLIEGWGTPARMFKAHSAWKDKGVKVVQVEPRLSSTAAKADKWVPVNPGTEGVLALGIAHVMIKEGLYNKDFVAKSFGFEDFKDSKGKAQKGFKSIVLENYTPSKVSGITGVDTGTIAEIAKAFAAASAPLALCGRGQGKTPGSIHEFIAVHALNALTGNINKKGGICAIKRDAYINWPAPEADAVAKEGLKTARADGAGAGKYAFAKSLLNRLPGVINAVEKEEDLPIQALFIRAANPAYTLTDAGAAKAALEKIPFIVCFASCMNETAEMADFILPEPGHLERCEDVPVPFGMNVPVMGLAKPVIKPQYKTMPAGDVLMLLARKLGDGVAKAFPWKNHAECLEKTLAGNWKPAMEKGFVALNTKPESEFATGSGKFEFMSAACAHDGKGGAFTGIEGDDAALPLILVPCDSMRLASGPVADTPFVMKIVEDTVLTGKDSWVEINGKTGGKCGLAEGVYAKLTTAKGTFKVRVHINNGLKPGVIAMPRGLGHTTAVDEYMSGKGINVNELMGTVEDPASGLDATVGTRAALVIA